MNLRNAFCVLAAVCISFVAMAQEGPSGSGKKLNAHVSFRLNSNGFAPIPSFSLEKPALMVSSNLVKGRFSYDPTLAYSLEMKPWFLDNWFHYRVILKPRFELMAGVNFSTFCSGFAVNDEEILKAERYFAFSLTGTYRFTPVSSLSLDYWSDNGQEHGTLTGHFLSLVYDRSDITLGEKALLSVNLMLFYINYDGNNDGLFLSPTVTLSVREIPFALFFQANQAVLTNISPWPGFKWNVGISYHL